MGACPAAPVVEITSPLVFVGDVRIDNRDQLRAALGPSARAQATDDARVVLAAYAMWGTNSAERLLGDFAFAVWDARRRILFGARDAFGVKCFHYTWLNSRFAFASDLGALLSHPKVARRLNEIALLDFLAGYVDDVEQTLYREVFRLPPAHAFTVEEGSMKRWRYWEPAAREELRLPSDDDYADAFREALTSAVAARLSSLGEVGISLSGGLDSSSIACVARPTAGRKLHAFSGIYDEVRGSDERRYGTAVARRTGAVHHLCHPDRLSPLHNGDAPVWRDDEPLAEPNISLFTAVNRRAREVGVTTMLSGIGGDFVVGFGLSRLTDLVRSLDLPAFVHESCAVCRRFQISLPALIRSRVLVPFAPVRVRTAWKLASGTDRRRLWSRGGILRPETVDRLDLDARWQIFDARRSPARTAREEHVRDVMSGLVPRALDICRRSADRFGIEYRFPFFDRRVVELCIALPAEQKLRDGWTRYIMRRALDGLLPEEVRWRTDKANLGLAFKAALQTTDRPVLDGVIQDPGLVAEWVDARALLHLYQRCLAHDDASDWYLLWRVVVAALWLRDRQFDDTPQPSSANLRPGLRPNL